MSKDPADVRISYIDCYAPFTVHCVGVVLKRSLVMSATAFSVRIQSCHSVVRVSRDFHLSPLASSISRSWKSLFASASYLASGWIGDNDGASRIITRVLI